MRTPSNVAILLAATLLVSCDDPNGPAPPLAQGTLFVSVSTTGAPLDLDGYGLVVDGDSVGAVDVNDTTTLEVVAGPHRVGLTHAAPNCSSQGAQWVSVGPEAQAEIGFEVSCDLLAELEGLRILLETPSGLLAMSADGEDEQLLVPGAGLHSPDVAFDGALAFTREHGDSSDLWVADPDGSNAVRLLAGHIQDPRWSPDGQHIAFADENGIQVTSRDGTVTSTRQANSTTYHAFRWPSWSPDGSGVAFEARYVTNDSNTVVIVHYEGVGGFLFGGGHPAWSADDRIAHMWAPEGWPERPHDIRVMDVADPLAGVTVLTTPRTEPAQPMDWSSDGTRLLYTGVNPTGGRDLYLLRVETGVSLRLTGSGDVGAAVFFPE